MIALRLGLVLVAAIVLVAFQPSLAFGQAEVTRWSSQETVNVTQDVPCLGILDITYITHSVIVERIDANGGFHYTYKLNLHQFSAYDESGNEYSGSESWTYSFSCGPGCEMPVEESWVRTLTGQSHGSGPNLLIKERYHLIINANGTPTASVDISSIECRPKE